jgi:hypothetical protein
VTTSITEHFIIIIIIIINIIIIGGGGGGGGGGGCGGSGSDSIMQLILCVMTFYKFPHKILYLAIAVKHS